MPEITPFDFNGHAVRVIMIDGEPWWFAQDVCDRLDLRIDAVMSALSDYEKFSSTIGESDILTYLISESGVYSTIFRSRKPEAEEFKRWVTHEVLPSIRRTGGYSVKPPAPVSALDALAGMVEALREQERATAAIKREQEEARREREGINHNLLQISDHVIEQSSVIGDLAADVADLKELAPVTAPLLLTLRDVAHAYDPAGGVGQNKMAKILHEAGILFKDHQSGWRIHQEWFKRGWGRDEFEPWQNGRGWSWVTKFTPAGLAEIMRQLREQA